MRFTNNLLQKLDYPIIIDMERLVVPIELNSGKVVEFYRASSISDLLSSADQVLADKYADFAAFLEKGPEEAKDLVRPFRIRNVSVFLTGVRHDPALETGSDKILTVFDTAGSLEVNAPSALNTLLMLLQGRRINFKSLREDTWLGDLWLQSTFYSRQSNTTHTLVSCTKRWQQQNVRPDPWWKRLPTFAPQAI